MNTLKNLTDTELVINYQNTQNAQAFGELYNRYNQKVFLYCAKVLKNREDALDLTQDIFVKIATKLAKLKEAVTFVKWLFRIAHNDCIDLLKANKKSRSTSLDAVYNIGAEEFDQEQAIEKDHQLAQLGVFMNQLPATEKSLLEEKYFKNKSIAELMVKYDLSTSAIKMRLARSRNKMKGLYAAF